jgi:hypothetical protein
MKRLSHKVQSLELPVVFSSLLPGCSVMQIYDVMHNCSFSGQFSGFVPLPISNKHFTVRSEAIAEWIAGNWAFAAFWAVLRYLVSNQLQIPLERA